MPTRCWSSRPPTPSRIRCTRLALESFAEEAGLRTSRALLGFADDTRQKIALLHDLDDDRRAGKLMWPKPPLELHLETPAGPPHLIGVHASYSREWCDGCG